MKKEYCKGIGTIIFIAVIICAVMCAGCNHSKKETCPVAAMTAVEKMSPHREMSKIEVEGDDQDDEHLSLDQVPAPVKATIMEQAQDGQIENIELKDEDGENLYEVDVVIDGKEYELKISPDGRLLSKESDDADEDKGDNDADEDEDADADDDEDDDADEDEGDDADDDEDDDADEELMTKTTMINY